MEQWAESHGVGWGGLMHTSQTLPVKQASDSVVSEVPAGGQVKCQFAPVPVRQRFSNFFQVGTIFISQNVLRTTLLLNVLSIC